MFSVLTQKGGRKKSDIKLNVGYSYMRKDVILYNLKLKASFVTLLHNTIYLFYSTVALFVSPSSGE